MRSASHPNSTAKKTAWFGYAVTALLLLFLLFDGVAKLLKPAPVVEATVALSYPESVIFGLGVLLLACLALYVAPRTSMLGASLLTGYLGGAIATHVRVGSDPFSVVFPVILGALLWGGLFCAITGCARLFPRASQTNLWHAALLASKRRQHDEGDCDDYDRSTNRLRSCKRPRNVLRNLRH
jgi:hypothetical protein